ncbi:hypothetical protein J1605_009824 [Eschrichtius robustus]|uniref:Uncharacterized protein n=1 Tax=Eschrichtius robustus TaxID=9764 RepID=A0AB34GWS4_ESCRO|nr:hypothetical protein J1605_009824 [Eschrichtius robustus]
MVSSCGGTSDKNGRKAPQALDQVMQPQSTPFPPAAPPPAPLRSGGCGLPRGSFSEAWKTEGYTCAVKAPLALRASSPPTAPPRIAGRGRAESPAAAAGASVTSLL